MRSTRTPAAVLAALAIVAAGCGSEPEPGGAAAASTTAPASQAPAPSTDAAGPLSTADLDVSTIDPCSVADPAVIADLGGQSLENPLIPVALDTCLGGITRPGQPELIIGIGPYRYREDVEEELGAPLTAEPRGDAELTAPTTEDDGNCTMHVVFADDVALRVFAGPMSDGTPAPPSCAEAEAIAVAAIAVLAEERFERFTFEAGSLAAANPCDALPADLTSRPGLDFLAGADLAVGPNGHECALTTENGAFVSTTFGIVPDGFLTPPEVPGSTAAAEETIAGRPTLVGSPLRLDDLGACVLSSTFAPFPQAGPGIVENVTVVVRLGDTTDEGMCDLGRTVAATLWPEFA